MVLATEPEPHYERQAAAILWWNATSNGPPASWGDWGHSWLEIEVPAGEPPIDSWGLYPGGDGGITDGHIQEPNDEYRNTAVRVGYALAADQLDQALELKAAMGTPNYIAAGNCTGYAADFVEAMGFDVLEYTSAFVPNPTELVYSIEVLREEAGAPQPVYVE